MSLKSSLRIVQQRIDREMLLSELIWKLQVQYHRSFDSEKE